MPRRVVVTLDGELAVPPAASRRHVGDSRQGDTGLLVPLATPHEHE
ncbi:hypothetical protein ACFQER_14830 [Halomicroarcula sp. GCM10025894]